MSVMSPRDHDNKRENESAKWVEVQKKAFTFWVNRQLLKRPDVPQIEDLQPDLSNGVRLIALVEALSEKPLEMKWSKQPVMKAHKITNCVLALGHLKNENVGHLTISAENFVNCDERELSLVLGFCWQLLKRYQGIGGSKNSSYEQSLLEWLRSLLKDYKDINLDDGFKSGSFHDGKVFLGLINEYRRGVIDYPSYNSKNKLFNCETAFKISEEQIGIPSLIDALEMSEGKTSDKSIVLYLSLWFNAFKELNQGISKEDLMRRIQELEEKIRRLMAENDELRRRLQSGIDSSANKAEQDMLDILRMLDELMRLKQTMGKENEEMAEKNRQLKERLAREEKDIERLQMLLCEKQEKEGGESIRLRLLLEKHLKDMHRWKEFQNFDRDYPSTDIHLSMAAKWTEPEPVGKEFDQESDLLAKLLAKRNSKGKDDTKSSSSTTTATATTASAKSSAAKESAPKESPSKETAKPVVVEEKKPVAQASSSSTSSTQESTASSASGTDSSDYSSTSSQ